MKSIIVVSIATVLTACGGGGGSSGPTNLQTAALPAQLLSPAFASEQLTASSNGVPLIMNISQQAAGMGTCNGMSDPYSTMSYTAQSSGDGGKAFFQQGTENDFYSSGAYVPCGGTIAQGVFIAIPQGAYIVTGYTPPSALTVGEAGQLASVEILDTNNANIGAATYTYSVAALSPTAVQLTLTTTFNGVSSSNTYAISASGSATLESFPLGNIVFTLPGA